MQKGKRFNLSETALGFRLSRILLTANNLQLFDHLERPLSSNALAKRLNLDRRATGLLLDALTSMKLLRKKEGRYQNTSIASRYLVAGRPYYQGNILRHIDMMWKNWSGLDDVIRSGEPKRAGFDHESFILGMHNIGSIKVRDLLRKIDLKGIKRILDLGGGPGTYSMAFAGRGREVTLFDLPETIRIARRVIDEGGSGGRVTFMEGDFTVDPIGEGYDLVFMSHILHSYGTGEIRRLLKKVRNALNPDGNIVIHDFYLDSSRTSPVTGAVFSINMLIHTFNGRTYSVQELKELLRKAGFRVRKVSRLDETVLVQARK
jgi:SAM-dependent methyltransferase